MVRVNATPIKEEILWEIDHLPLHSQKLVLDFARALRSTFNQGVSGRELLRFAGTLPPGEGELMNQAIEDACERVEQDEW
ncbi:hypothetical protein HX99_01060 [Peptococcaceae bacterium SCADC1_2_3]|nr:hypothetical protein DK28_0208400 [Peptococcaceae bacterium SCADC1_2_3]KFI36801.1 hypothetical protein HX99_01060 [Peptococcaceae bacterium SCADC1_2_3]KFI38027.1 hypothetical protein HY02_09495 [Peptococcaceae bacterium SCADC1_2_3]